MKKKQGEEAEGASSMPAMVQGYSQPSRRRSGEVTSADMVAAWELPETLGGIIVLYCTNEDLMELKAQRKDEERQEEEEITEELKRFTMLEMTR